MLNIGNKKLTKEDYYKVYNLYVIPGLIIGIAGGIGYGTADLTDGDNFIEAIGFGLFPLFVGYYPIKLIVFLVNRFRNNKWEWPIGYKYFVLPALIILVILIGS